MALASANRVPEGIKESKHAVLLAASALSC